MDFKKTSIFMEFDFPLFYVFVRRRYNTAPIPMKRRRALNSVHKIWRNNYSAAANSRLDMKPERGR
jgi:hypothetical protein